MEFSTRLSSPKEYSAFQDTPEGAYLLYAIEAYENAMNDDWLRYEIIGLQLERALEFITRLKSELESDPDTSIHSKPKGSLFSTLRTLN